MQLWLAPVQKACMLGQVGVFLGPLPKDLPQLAEGELAVPILVCLLKELLHRM